MIGKYAIRNRSSPILFKKKQEQDFNQSLGFVLLKISTFTNH